MSDTPTPDELAAIRARHRPDSATGLLCFACAAHWPCDAARLLAALDDECRKSESLAATLTAREEDGTAQDALAAGDIAMLLEQREQARRERDEARAALSAAEVRLTAKDGHTIVVTAAELDRAWREERAIAERARFWAAGWRRAAYDRRDLADLALDAGARADERLAARQAEHDGWLARAARAGMFPAETAAVVEAARAAVAGAEYRFPLADLRDALAAYDAAEGDRP